MQLFSRHNCLWTYIHNKNPATLHFYCIILYHKYMHVCIIICTIYLSYCCNSYDFYSSTVHEKSCRELPLFVTIILESQTSCYTQIPFIVAINPANNCTYPLLMYIIFPRLTYVCYCRWPVCFSRENPTMYQIGGS